MTVLPPNNEDPAIVKDREIPEIASSEKSSNIPVILGGIALIALLAYLNFFGEENKVSKMTDKKPEEFRPTNIVNAPVLPEPKAPAPTPPRLSSSAQAIPVTTGISFNPLEQERLLMMHQAALKLAADNRRKMEQRKRSPIMLFDQNDSEEDKKTGNSTSQVSDLTALLNPYQQFQNEQQKTQNNVNKENKFLNAQENNSVSMVSASLLKNQNALIAQGSLINGVLETAIQSNLPGFIRAVVSHPVYSFDGTTLLVPEGSRLIGKYQAGMKNGQTRVFIIWSRILRPDGVSILIGSPGTDRLGRAGLGGDVDVHFWERFGTSILMSFIDGGIKAGINAIDNSEASTIAVNTGSGFSKAAETVLEYSINIEPTLHVDQGTRINVFVAKDLDFSNVQNKRVR